MATKLSCGSLPSKSARRTGLVDRNTVRPRRALGASSTQVTRPGRRGFAANSGCSADLGGLVAWVKDASGVRRPKGVTVAAAMWAGIALVPGFLAARSYVTGNGLPLVPASLALVTAAIAVPFFRASRWARVFSSSCWWRRYSCSLHIHCGHSARLHDAPRDRVVLQRARRGTPLGTPHACGRRANGPA
jgi:hypothetical protein